MPKVTHKDFHRAMQALATALGMTYDDGDFDIDEDHYSFSVLGQIHKATRNAEALSKQYSRLQSDLQLVLNHLKLQIVTYPETKKVEKVKKAK